MTELNLCKRCNSCICKEEYCNECLWKMERDLEEKELK